MTCHSSLISFFFFNDTATTEIYTLSLHDALPISSTTPRRTSRARSCRPEMASPAPTYERSRTSSTRCPSSVRSAARSRSEEHTSELQSLAYLVCRLLLEKKKNNEKNTTSRCIKQQ